MKRLLLFSLIISSQVFAINPIGPKVQMGDGVGNGGDVAICSYSDEGQFEGIYTLDYLLTFQKRNNNEDVDSIEMGSWRDYATAIHAKLKALAPEMGLSFKEFIEDTDNYTDESRFRIWREASHGLIDIRDEGMFKKLPENCRTVQQAIIRVDYGYSVEYYLDTVVEQQLSTQALQYSMLMLHEFARDYTNETRAIRRFVRYLHSKSFIENDTLTPEQFSRILKKMTVIKVEEQTIYTQDEIDQNFLNDLRLDNMDYVKHWLKLGADPMARTEHSETALMKSVESKNIEMVKLILELGVYVTSADNNEKTALMYAGEQGVSSIVTMLIEHGAKVEERDQGNNDALGYAVEGEHLNAVKVLVGAGADINRSTFNNTGILRKSLDESISIFYFLIGIGIDVDRCVGGQSLFRDVVLYWNAKTVRLLAENGADLNFISNYQTPLDRAIDYYDEHNSTERIELLLELGADINFTGTGYPPLVKTSSLRLMSYLIEHGADVNLKYSNYLGEEVTALMSKSSAKEIGSVKLLLQAGAKIDATCADGNTALHYTVLENVDGRVVDMIRILILAGADPKQANNSGQTFMDLLELVPNHELIVDVIKDLL